jgi:hypothetical protein
VSKTKKTAVVKNSANPEYSESFHFRLEEDQLDVTSIHVTVVEETSVFAKDRPVAYCILGGFMFARGKGEEHWDKVKKSPKEQIEMWHPLVPISHGKRGRDKAPPPSPRKEANSRAALF